MPPAQPAPVPEPPPATTWNSDFDVGAMTWRAAVRGDITADARGIKGTELDFDSDLGFDRREQLYTYYARADIDTNWRFSLEYYEYDATGNSTLYNDVYYSGELIEAGTDLYNKLDFKSLAFDVGYKIYDYRGWCYGPTIGVFGTEGDSSLTGQAEGLYPLYIKDDWRLITPTVGFFGSYLSRAGIEVSWDFSIMYLKYRSSLAKYLDTMPTIAYYPMDNLAFYAGYRFTKLVGKDDDVDIQTRFIGPTFGFWFKF